MQGFKRPTHAMPSLRRGAWRAKATKPFNFKKPDSLDAATFNRLLWPGIKGDDKPYLVRPGARREADD
jgi:hypothetical protein